jgi:hypothetical protein
MRRYGRLKIDLRVHLVSLLAAVAVQCLQRKVKSNTDVLAICPSPHLLGEYRSHKSRCSHHWHEFGQLGAIRRWGCRCDGPSMLENVKNLLHFFPPIVQAHDRIDRRRLRKHAPQSLGMLSSTRSMWPELLSNSGPWTAALYKTAGHGSHPCLPNSHLLAQHEDREQQRADYLKNCDTKVRPTLLTSPHTLLPSPDKCCRPSGNKCKMLAATRASRASPADP